MRELRNRRKEGAFPYHTITKLLMFVIQTRERKKTKVSRCFLVTSVRH